MTLKLSKLPNRTPIKVTSTFPPDVHDALTDYARIYEDTYGANEKIEDLVPYIIANFLESDSGFKKARRQLTATTAKPTTRPPINPASANQSREGDK